MSGNGKSAQSGAVFHRLRSPTQTAAVDQMQVSSGQVCGRPAWGSSFPTVKAYPGPLPAGASGIEFSTTIAPTPGGSTPSMTKWYQGTSGVINTAPGLVCIPVTVIKVVP